MPALKVKANDLRGLRVKAVEFLNQWKSRGRKTTTWHCPHCRKSNEVAQPDHIDVEDSVNEDELGFWSSATTCLHCGSVSMVKTYPNGQTDVINM